jgi:hypothetical protein
MGRERARLTIETCKLQRGALRTERLDRYEAVDHAARLNDLERVLEPRYPYKFVVRFVLTRMGRRELAEMDRQRFLAEG